MAGHPAPPYNPAMPDLVPQHLLLTYLHGCEKRGDTSGINNADLPKLAKHLCRTEDDIRMGLAVLIEDGLVRAKNGRYLLTDAGKARAIS